MPRPKGLPKTGGRKKGITAKLSKEVASRLNEMGCDPVGGLADLGMSADIDPSVRRAAYAELMKYIYPRLSAIDHRLVDAEGRDRSVLSEFDRLVAAAEAAQLATKPVQ